MEYLSCFCAIDQDGHCKDCKDELIEGCKRAFVVFKAMVDELERMAPKATGSDRDIVDKYRVSLEVEAPCDECHWKYADLALSSFIPMLKDNSYEFAEMYIGNLKTVCATKGLAIMPLVDKAWADLRARKQWF